MLALSRNGIGPTYLVSLCYSSTCILLELRSVVRRDPSDCCCLQFRESNAAMSGLTESKERADEVYTRYLLLTS
jgi:hypothetical protein